MTAKDPFKLMSESERLRYADALDRFIDKAGRNPRLADHLRQGARMARQVETGSFYEGTQFR